MVRGMNRRRPQPTRRVTVRRGASAGGAEKALPPSRLRRRFLASIADASAWIGVLSTLHDVYFFMKDREGRFMGANALQLSKLGLGREADLIGKTDRDFFPESLVTPYLVDDRRVMDTGVPIRNRVEPVANPDGTVSWHLTSKFPLRDAGGRCVGIAGVMRNFDGASRTWLPHSRLVKVLEHIAAHFQERLTMGDLAAMEGLSLSQFERRFREAFGQTPSRFLARFRLTRAGQLLVETDRTLSDIALSCGFYDHSHFTRAFREMFGLAPGAYRKRARA